MMYSGDEDMPDEITSGPIQDDSEFRCDICGKIKPLTEEHICRDCRDDRSDERGY